MRKLKNNELNRLNLQEFKTSQKTPLVIVLDNVRSAHNVGSVFRTSDAFLVEKICLCGITPTPPHKEIRKTALGASESVNWQYYANSMECIQELTTCGYHIISIEQADKAIMLYDFNPKKNMKYALVLGNEVKGVDQSIVSASNTVIEIPQYGTKHSLNISVSSGVVIWDFFQKLQV
ncbi:MAG: RNA methyltransferase [Flavobacteriales bacterium]|nr:RNA methyltransferase [Flavobacteriales bacterium]|tara:strand:+ start:16995 stop:17525 length:531 start_codon:yes stop_codon:yes gene_type:complete